ncbi:interferon gamma receptor 1 isoform X2 [Phaenicophaeus curvirostris]|uniref:interferon gamma receptor 1 isoform X2 n=1 Tax=Phaenicophaeus curvirostris TaxID=33595 RepID=UPI0037F0BEEA
MLESPTQIVVTSENFKTILHWEYPLMSETPHFIVEIKPYNLGKYKNISTCMNITDHFCDFSREIDDVSSSHWLRVKAIVGSQQSEYVEAEEFILQKHGKIGPPKLNLSRHNDEIVVDIYHPPFPSVEHLPLIKDVYSDIEYLVTFWDSKNETKEDNLKTDLEESCTMSKCVLSIPVTAEGSTYCVSAKGSLHGYLMISAPSESCIHVPLKYTMSTQDIIILCAVILSLSLIFAAYCGYKKLRKKNVKLPKSLVSVIRNLNKDNILESKSEAKYTSVINFVSDHSALPVTSLEEVPKEEIVSPENSSEGTSFVPPPEAPVKTEEVSVQEDTEEISSDDEQTHKVKESYFISDSRQMDICSSSSGSEISAAEIQQTVLPSSCLKFSGYDKPHVPLNMLIDVGEDQPVIAYRPTD